MKDTSRNSAPSAQQKTPFRATLLHPRYWKKWSVIAVLSLLNLLPFSVLDALGTAIGSLCYRYYHKHRRVVRLNIDRCFPALSDDEKNHLIKTHFTAYTQSLLMLPLLWWGRGDTLAHRVTLDNRSVLDAALARGPVIILSCHSVMLNYGGSAIAWQYSAVSMYRRFKNPLDEWLILRARSRFNNHLVARGSSLRTLIRLTRSGTPCYHMPDQDLGAEGAVFAPFFGQPKATLTAMAKLTRATQASVVPCYPYYLGKGRFKVQFLPAINNYPGDDEVHNAHIINQTLETLIRLQPAQYLWKLHLFKTGEDARANPYDPPIDKHIT